MKQVWLTAAAVSALIVSGIANAEPTVQNPATGNGLLANCISSNHSDQLVCMAYVAGAASMAGALGESCRSGEVTVEQTKDVVVKGLQSDPANRHKPSSLLILIYLREAFPCKK